MNGVFIHDQLLMLLVVFSDSDSALKKFLEETTNMSPDERAKHLEKNQVR